MRLFELGHSFDYIDDELHLGDLGDILGYWSGKAKGEEKMRKIAQRRASRRHG